MPASPAHTSSRQIEITHHALAGSSSFSGSGWAMTGSIGGRREQRQGFPVKIGLEQFTSVKRRKLKPRSQQPFDTLDAVLMTMIEAHVGKPCPTRQEVREWTGMPRRNVWPYLEGMRDRGLIELEVQESKPVGKDPKRRRMRKAGGKWTLWTARPGRRACVEVEATFVPHR